MGQMEFIQENEGQQIRVNLAQDDHGFVDLFDAFGNVMVHLRNVRDSFVISMSHLSSGIYLVMVSTEVGGVRIKKVVKP